MTGRQKALASPMGLRGTGPLQAEVRRARGVRVNKPLLVL
jgi:hypothetical protein